MPQMPPTRPERALPDGPDKPGRKWTAAVVGLVVVFGGLAAYDLATSSSALNAEPAASAAGPHAASLSHSAANRASGTPSATRTATSRPSPTATGSASPTGSPSATAGAVGTLSAVSVAAFGPNGTSDGDNPGNASRVLAGGGTSAWSSAWYATPYFGNLQAGTGLLVDMGKKVWVSTVRLVLADSAGANVQARLGDSAIPADLSTAASASDADGTVYLPLPSPVHARYVLIWFTKLPPNSQGNYQVMVYNITVDGRA